MLNTTNKKDKFTINIKVIGDNLDNYYEILVTENQKISELRQQVINTLQLELPSKCFIFAGKRLECHKTLKDYNIMHGENIYLNTLKHLENINITVNVRTFDGQCYPITVTNADPLRVIAEALSNKGLNLNFDSKIDPYDCNTNMNITSFFYLNGYPLPNDKLVYDLKLQDNDELMLVQPNPYGKLMLNIDARSYQGEYYSKDIFSLNYRGMQLIADRYNQKYFNNTDRKIIVTKSFSECLNEMQQFMNDSRINIIGLTYPHFGAKNFNGHHCVLILEKLNNGNIKIYDADNVVLYSYKLIMASEFYNQNKDKLEILCALYSRQAGNGPCKTESLVFLKNTLLLDNVYTHVKIASKEKLNELKKTFPLGCKGFLYTEPLLKTAQMSTTIKGCGIDENSQKILLNTGGQGKNKPLTFSKFQAKHYTKELCKPINLNKKSSSSNNENTLAYSLIKERGYVSKKLRDHCKQTTTEANTTRVKSLPSL